MNLSVADSGSLSSVLVSETRVLWKRLPDEVVTSTSVEQKCKCPSILPISIQIPPFYEVQGKVWRLPPSYEATFLGIPALFVRCMYTLSVTITRTRSYRLASWTTNKTWVLPAQSTECWPSLIRYMVLLNYRPRTRPHRPVILLDSVFASIKPVPEDWQQLMANMHVRPNSGMKHIECHVRPLALLSSSSISVWPQI